MKKKGKIILGSVITTAVAVPAVTLTGIMVAKHHKESDGDQKVATDSSKESLLKTIQGIELDDNEKVLSIPEAENKGEIAYNQTIIKLANLKRAALKKNISVQELRKIKEKILQVIQEAKDANSQQQIANDNVKFNLKINFPGTYTGIKAYENTFYHKKSIGGFSVADKANNFNEQNLSKAIKEKIATFEKSELFQKYGNYIYGQFLNIRTSLITYNTATNFSVNLSETEKITSKTSLSTQKYENFGQNQYFQDGSIKSHFQDYSLFYASRGDIYSKNEFTYVQDHNHYYKNKGHKEELSYKNDFEAIKKTNLQFRSLRFGITFNDKKDAQDWVDFIAELHNASLNGSTFAYNDDGEIPLDQNFTKSINDIFKKYSTSLTVSRFINWFITQDIPNNLPFLV